MLKINFERIVMIRDEAQLGLKIVTITFTVPSVLNGYPITHVVKDVEIQDEQLYMHCMVKLFARKFNSL